MSKKVKSQKSAMPKSKAKTAHELLAEVRALILEEPKRYDQHGVLIRFSERDIENDSALPACGTVGCVAGWVTALKRPSAKWPVSTAASILGISDYQSPELFRASHAGDRDPIHPLAHAKRGAAHIARFMKKYAKQLKAKKLTNRVEGVTHERPHPGRPSDAPDERTQR